MKQFLLLIGLSVFSTAAFSQQQISNAKKPASVQVPVETTTPQELISDSIVINNSMKKQTDPISPVEPKENQGSNGQEKPALISTKRKPE